jgi:hypothetical protein
MNMKIMTVLAVASLSIAGAACSEAKVKASPESTDTVAVESTAGGTLNLSLPSSVSDTGSAAGGTLNLNLGGADAGEPRLIGSDQIRGVDFESVPEPAFAIEPDDAPAADDGDDIIRLQPN